MNQLDLRLDDSHIESKLGRPIKNLIGRVFGKLKVIEFAYTDKRRGAYWNCECSCDGKKVVIKAHGLTRKDGTKSCGCLQKPRGANNKLWKGCGNISGQHFSRVRMNAQERCLPFNITIEQIWGLFLKQDRKCTLSGVKLKFESKTNTHDGSASLDRIDSSRGYNIDNIQWVHKDINFAKQSMSNGDFIKICESVVNHQNSFKRVQRF